jgi:acetyl esterase/lipase
MKNLLILFLFMQVAAFSQKIIPLYNGAIPLSRNAADQERTEVGTDGITRIFAISRPTLTVFLPQRSNKPAPAVIICPGGGYHINAFSHEGIDVAKVFNSWGIAAFVLKYRIPDATQMNHQEIVPMLDVQQALQMVRAQADEFGINPNQVGVMGFSAGGHLASTTATHFEKPAAEFLSGKNLRPDFQILIYPVISFQESFGHLGSRDNLLGKNASKSLIDQFSNELQVSAKTPPAFLVHAGDDEVVPVENSIRYYEALNKNKVNAELHVYPSGGHGFGMNNPTTKDQWMESLKNWLENLTR